MTSNLHSRPGPDENHDMAIGTPTRQRFVIASIPRSGSSLLSWALWATGEAGAPNEYLNPLQRRWFEKRWGPMPLEVYVERLERHRTSANGVFGLKLHHHHRLRWVDRFGHDLTALFPDALYVAVTRQDRLAQAVSLEIAHQTGRWSSEQPLPDRQPVYRQEAIAHRLIQIERAETGWEHFFDRFHITPVRLTHEDLVAELPTAVDKVLDRLGVERQPAAVPPAPPITRQGDEINMAWIEQFRRSR